MKDEIERVIAAVLGYDEKVGIMIGFTYEDKEKNLVTGYQPHNSNLPELPVGTEYTLRFTLISRHLRWLQGEILTILEATIEDDRKLKAVKDLVKDKISSKISWLYEQCGCPESQEDGLVDPE